VIDAQRGELRPTAEQGNECSLGDAAGYGLCHRACDSGAQRRHDKLKVFKRGLLLASFSMSWSTATASPGLLMSDIPSSVPIDLQCARLTGSGEIGA
jgi:hypothetical protein